MSAVGRLWRRAPLWRASLVTAAAATCLAALYPPGSRQSAAAIASRYAPLTAAQVMGGPWRNIFAVPGRRIPLPAGEWHPVTRSESKGAMRMVSVLLVRMARGRPTGYVVVQSSLPGSDAMQNVRLNYNCAADDDLAADILPVAAGVQQECWNLRARVLPRDWSNPQTAAVYTHAAAHLREGGIDISGVVVGANWFRADDRGFVLVDYFFPPGATPGMPDTQAAWRKDAALSDPRTAGYLAGLQAWTLAWTALLESGADDTLTAGTVADVAARHPI